jgi:hypothetical protein
MGIWLAVSTSLCDELAHRAVFTKPGTPPTGIRSLGRMIRATSKALPVVFQVIRKDMGAIGLEVSGRRLKLA